jgi:hypothetical protein
MEGLVMTTIKDWTVKEVVDEMNSETTLNNVRRLFAFGSAKIENANAQKTPLNIIEMRKMEFEIAQKIINLVRAAV